MAVYTKLSENELKEFAYSTTLLHRLGAKKLSICINNGLTHNTFKIP